MKQFKLLILLLSTVFLASGCLYVETTLPGTTSASTSYQLNSSDFKVLKRVEVEGTTTAWFGAVVLGGKGYQALLEKSKEMGGDAIMNYTFDIEQKSILFFIYSKIKWKASGLAIKYDQKMFGQSK